MLPPERRTRADLLIAAAIAVVVLVTLGVTWLRSDARATESMTAATPAVVPEPATQIPEILRAVWDAPSGATTFPVVEGGAVVSADGSTVIGHDPETGEQLWRYSRDLELCGVVGAWQRAISVFRDDRGCSQVTALDASSGVRAAQRSSDADSDVTLVGGGTYLVVFGDQRLESWRSDLVRTVEYGRVDAPVNPGKQPRPECNLVDAKANGSRLVVLEQCPGENVERLSLLAPAPSDAQEPQEFSSKILAEVDQPGARIVAVAGERTAL
ncbi:MAG: PQQ-binding-like beta-propeller repeat protein, partial [Rhodococcus sp.]|nr:PQQ-binding-like beta-propeller repeat protein [Rhodococcus sp. (in: high G+C Gram-positive bacteria)]